MKAVQPRSILKSLAAPHNVTASMDNFEGFALGALEQKCTHCQESETEEKKANYKLPHNVLKDPTAER